jgi:dTDP-4-dehydrorhamnose 3,5-epimerase
MKITCTGIDGVVVAESTAFSDHRGTFTRLFCASDLAPIIGSRHITQINKSRTAGVGAARGLHYQRSPYAETKFVFCLKGKIWDVAVDLRTGSATLLHWHAEELSAGNCRMLIIPEGCAHGFQVLEPDSEILYLHTAPYDPASESGVQVSDPLLNISWPLPIHDLSERDKTHPLLPRGFAGITL